MIQQTGLFPHQTIEENVATVPRLLGWPKARRHERAEELPRARRAGPGRATPAAIPPQLSGGERQRVGVARALAADPPIMLMDEPFGAVDPIVRERLQNEFLRLQEQLAKTILFVTHDIDEAIKMGDLVAVFRAGGVVEQFGPPAEILAAPASPFVARFVGADRGLKRLSPDPGRRPGARAGPSRRGSATTPRDARDGAAGRPVRVPAPARRRRTGRSAGSTSTRSPQTGVLAAELVETTSPLLDRRTTLKDALSMLLDARRPGGRRRRPPRRLPRA